MAAASKTTRWEHVGSIVELQHARETPQHYARFAAQPFHQQVRDRPPFTVEADFIFMLAC
jgi:hypothetical protein